jgi:RNA polymerase sigma-70 factor (ECF subfamily)
MNNSYDPAGLVEEFGPKISGLARRMIRDRALAEEAAQEVWYEITRSLGGFRGESRISTWIYTVARRTILRFARNERVYKEKEFNAHFEKAEIVFSGQEAARKAWVTDKCDDCLTAFCHCLTNEARLVFLLKEIVNLPYDEIAAVMEASEAGVRQTLSRSVKKVRNFLAKNCILYNQDATCSCRIRKEVLRVDLAAEYARLQNTAESISLFLKFEEELPRKNYWMKLISPVTN